MGRPAIPNLAVRRNFRSRQIAVSPRSRGVAIRLRRALQGAITRNIRIVCPGFSNLKCSSNVCVSQYGRAGVADRRRPANPGHRGAYHPEPRCRLTHPTAPPSSSTPPRPTIKTLCAILPNLRADIHRRIGVKYGVEQSSPGQRPRKLFLHETL